MSHNLYGGHGDGQLRPPGADSPVNPFTTPNTQGSRPNSSYFPRDESIPLANTGGMAETGAGAGVGAGAGAGAGAGIPMSMSNASMASRTPGNRDSMAYQNIPSEQYWSEPSRYSTGPLAPTHDDDDYVPTGKSNKKKWIIGGIVLGVLAIIAIVVGVVVSQTVGKSDSSNGSNGSGQSSGNGTVGQTDPNDPSTFTKDDRLHQSFWAMAYTPQGSQPPACGANQANVTRDIQLLSQLTTRLRLYGANCNDTALVMQAIKDTKVDMKIWPAIYIDSNEAAYTAQVSALEEALKQYGTDIVEGVIVGNEFLLNDVGAINTTSVYTTSVQSLLTRVDDVRQQLTTWGLDKTLPVGTSDAGSVMSTQLATGIDFFMANVHPFFGNQGIQTASWWTDWFFQNFDVAVAATAPNNPKCYIAETGWPSESLTAADSNSGFGGPEGEATVPNLQIFLDTFVCNSTDYFYFEAFDEPWKAQYGGVEPFWGLFDSDRNLKDITIPTCN